MKKFDKFDEYVKAMKLNPKSDLAKVSFKLHNAKTNEERIALYNEVKWAVPTSYQEGRRLEEIEEALEALMAKS